MEPKDKEGRQAPAPQDTADGQRRGEKKGDRREFLKQAGMGAGVLANFVILGGAARKVSAQTTGCPSDGGGADVCEPSQGNNDDCWNAYFTPGGTLVPEVGDVCGSGGQGTGGDVDVCVAPYTAATGDVCVPAFSAGDW